MTPLLPGDQLWNRYRVEQVAHTQLEGAWLTLLHPDKPIKPRYGFTAAGLPCNFADFDKPRFLLLPLSVAPSFTPLADFLTFLESIEPARRAATDVSPLLDSFDFIGDPSLGGCAVVSAPVATPLSSLVSKSGPLPAPQILAMMTELSRTLNRLLKIGAEHARTRGTGPANIALLLSRVIQPGGLAIKADNARLTLKLELPDVARSPGGTGVLSWPDLMAPEIYRNVAATPAACVFGVARIAAYCAGYREEKTPAASANEATAFAALADWVSGKRDPAREFSESPQGRSLPEEFSQLLARCLSKRADRRISTLAKLEIALEKLADTAWAEAGSPCEYCGYIMAEPATCACCGKAPFNRGISEQAQDSAAGGKSKTGVTARIRKGGAPADAKTKTQFDAPVAVAVLAPPGMTLIPGGVFLSGEKKVPRNLRGFAIDTLPVTEGEYKTYLVANGRTPREDGPGSRDAALDNHPVTGVNWLEASEFATFNEKRLPTVYEWEKAARGTDGRKFPFGNVFKSGCGRLRPSEGEKPEKAEKAEKSRGTVPVGTHPDGASPYGVLDMAGNVLEWTSSARRAGTRLFRAVKGACYKDGSTELARCASVQYLPAECNEPVLGFRCVKDLE